MGATTLTPRDQEMLATAIQHCLANPEGLKIDYKAFAKHNGLANEDSARSCWSGLRRRLLAGGTQNESNGNDACTPTKSTPKKRARKADGEGETPVKKSRKSGKGKTAVQVEEDGDAIDGVKVKDEIELNEDGENGIAV